VGMWLESDFAASSFAQLRTDDEQTGSLLLKPGQHDRSPVTTKHEKRLYGNPCLR
jgi:hypothetical protein